MARILFVDDDPLTLAVLTKATEIIGHQALLAHSGAEALYIANAQHPDIIFIDQRLPDMNGVSVISSLRKNSATASIPLIMLSAGAELDSEEAALSAGARAFIRKPVQLQTLQDLVLQYIPLEPQSP